ncbi:MAG: response regulator [Actinobacteria bacterium]|nr:response regulator [Actinomycetota bacterium]NBY15841.1 response regulator [Actinomycetota bacterium]
MTRTRVVVADDEAIIRMDLVELLEHAGYEVVGQASDGKAALQAIKELAPDVAVLDVKMPLLDGIEVAHNIREHIPVVLVTAFGQADVIAQAGSAGVMGYVMKPFTEADVVAAIEIAISRFADLKSLGAQRDSLAESLETRKILDRAKGLLQSKLSLDEQQAFRWLQKAAMDKRLSVRAVAESVIAELGQ